MYVNINQLLIFISSLYIYVHSWISQFSNVKVCLCWWHGSTKSTQTRRLVIQICLFRACIQFFVGCVSWIFPYSVASSLPWLHVATRVEKKGLSLPPWDCPLYSTGKVLSFIHVMNPRSCSLSFCGQDDWTLQSCFHFMWLWSNCISVHHLHSHSHLTSWDIRPMNYLPTVQPSWPQA